MCFCLWDAVFVFLYSFFFCSLQCFFFNVFVIVVTKYLTCYSVSVFCFFLFIVCKLCLRVPLKCKSVWVGSFVVFFPFASSIRRGLFLWCYTFIVVVTTSQPHYIVFNFYLKLYSFSFLLLFFFFLLFCLLNDNHFYLEKKKKKKLVDLHTSVCLSV